GGPRSRPATRAGGGPFPPAGGCPGRRRSPPATAPAAPTTRRWLRRDGTAILFQDAHPHVGDIGHVPHALLTGDTPKVHRAVSQPGSRLLRRRLRRKRHGNHGRENGAPTDNKAPVKQATAHAHA